MSAKSSIRVLICAPSQGRYGGIEAVMLGLAESLADIPEFAPRLCFKLVRGATFDASLAAQCQAIGVPHVVVPRASHILWENLCWADVVHSHNPSPDIVFGSRLCRRPLLLTIINHKPEASTMHTRLWSLGLRLADVRCYISDFVRRTWEPNGLHPGSQVMPAISRRPAGPVTWDRAGFFFIGRWIANKGIEELIEAYATGEFDRTLWPLTLAGDGPLRPQVEELIKKHALSSVRLPGFVNEKEKFQLMSHAKWNVAPPHTLEDLGLTPIEARHLAVPSVITRDGGLPEAAGPFALVAEPDDVTSLRTQLEEAAAMSEEEYQRRAIGSQTQLSEFLRPLADYHTLYRQLGQLRDRS